jgi:succinate dehydrogenase / fumarate reductase membrane anchor subunit
MSADLRHPLARVRGLGSARHGSGHWIAQRLTAIALAPLSVWFLWAALALVAGGYADARAFLAQPWNAVLMALFVLCLFHHAQLGMQVVVEDYVHTAWAEYGLVIAIKFACALGALASVLAIVRIALGS